MNKKREQNERKYGNWDELPDGKRKYWFDVKGKNNAKARYIKEVNEDDEIISFRQEIYDSQDKLIEIHEKYPVDLGHKKI